MTPRNTSRCLVVAAAALSTALAVGAAPAVAAPTTRTDVAVAAAHSPIPNAPLCRKALDRLDLYRNSSAFTPPSTLTILDKTITVDPAHLNTVSPPFSDPSRVLWFRSLLWLTVAAVDAAEHGNRTLAQQLADDAVKAANAVPDPGTSTPERKKLAHAIGWDAGTAVRRSQALLCLSAFTGADRVRGLLHMHANALLDPNRYGGPPQRPVANMGMLSNLVLLDIAKVVDAPAIRDAAIGRLIRDQQTVFTPLGWTHEGSTSYHTVNIDGWRTVEAVLRDGGYTAEADALSLRLTAATNAAAQLIGPTAQQVLIGNSRPTDVVIRPGASNKRPLLSVDVPGGLAVGRWSWSDRRTTWWTVQNRDRRGLHGHDDNTSLTWQTAGVPILVDPGQPDYDPASNPYTAWSRTPQAHNRAVPARVGGDSRKLRSTSAVRHGTIDDIRLATSDQGPEQFRRVLVDHRRGSIEVVDDVPGTMVQYWHLGPDWRVRNRSRHLAVLVGPNGRILTVRSPDGVISQLVGSRSPMGGWRVTDFERQVPATELRIRGRGNLTTTFDQAASAAVKPAPMPRILATTTVGPRWVALRWAIPGTTAKRGKSRRTPAVARVVGYRIQVKSPGQPWRTWRVDTRRAIPQARLSGLQTGVGYRFRVAALTANATGSYSAPRRFVPRAPKPKVEPKSTPTATATPTPAP